mgnify:CR=1 FL=1
MAREKKNKKNLMMIVGICIVLAILIIAIIYFSKNDNASIKQESKSNTSISKITNKEDKGVVTITDDDKVTIDGYCEFNVKGTSFSKKVEPTNPTGYYTYLDIKDDSQKYLEITMNVKNLSSSALKQDSLLSVKVKYDNNYEYNCGLVTEDAKGNDIETFPNLYSIEPLKSLKYRFVVEMPKEVENDDKPLQAIITAKGNTYVYNIR